MLYVTNHVIYLVDCISLTTNVQWYCNCMFCTYCGFQLPRYCDLFVTTVFTRHLIHTTLPCVHGDLVRITERGSDV